MPRSPSPSTDGGGDSPRTPVTRAASAAAAAAIRSASAVGSARKRILGDKATMPPPASANNKENVAPPAMRRTLSVQLSRVRVPASAVNPNQLAEYEESQSNAASNGRSNGQATSTSSTEQMRVTSPIEKKSRKQDNRKAKQDKEERRRLDAHEKLKRIKVRLQGPA